MIVTAKTVMVAVRANDPEGERAIQDRNNYGLQKCTALPMIVEMLVGRADMPHGFDFCSQRKAKRSLSAG